LFLVDGKRCEHVALAAGEEIAEAYASFAREALARPASSDMRACDAACAALASKLLPPRACELVRAWSSVTVVGADLLGTMPLEALSIEKLGRIGLTKPVCTLPSIPFALEMARRTFVDPEIALLAFVAPEYGDEVHERWPALAPIPWTDDDTRKLERAFSNDSVQVRRGAAADVKALGTMRARTLLVLTHGVEDANRVRPAALLLAPDAKSANAAEKAGILASEDVERFYANGDAPQLVVLAACGTSRAPLRKGDDGANHLGGAFFASGAQCVVLSSADLDLEATRRMLDVFFAPTAKDQSPAEAMRAARAKLVADDARFAHPYYHALFQVVGLGQRAR
jgi:CHAT domain-containing protein